MTPVHTFLLVAAATLGLAGAVAASDFRGNDWGATLAAVKAHEKLVLVSETERELVYGAVVGKMAGEVHYRFGAHGLFEAHIVSTQAYADPLEHIGDYVRLHEIVTLAHGNAVIDQTSFREEKVRTDPEAWPAALRSGDMVMHAKFIRPRTPVVLRLGAPDGQMQLRADFLSATVREGEP